jgi:hypothetical protein
MIITNTITKKLLENLVHQTFLKFGMISSSSLLDSLKLLGFSYATAAGISINIEDLKTPDIKDSFIKNAQSEIKNISNQWQQGYVSDTERFQTIIDSWNIATESLKNRIIEYYQNYDPANNLYIMAFSGARGNMSQVRQLVGMRGLMSDQEGKIIDLPIQSNFREGLSSIDYIISSYGARKGIVDTALKTADSGYLTRRLIYVAQDLIIRQKDCGTKEGVLFFLEKTTNSKNILGRSFIPTKDFPISFLKKNNILDIESINILKNYFPITINIRSSLTCKSNGSICQNCYGWDLAHGKLISLGEAVGIIAAQSIGEPGTQLTMRTFHTGGIFTGELVKQIKASFSGKIILPESFKTIPYRTSHGNLVLKLQQEISITLINWKGISKEIFLDIGSYLYIQSSSFVKKGELIAEYMTQSVLPGGRRLKPIYSSFLGEIRFENLLIRKILREKRIVKVNQDDGILWVAGGKLFVLPKECEFLTQKSLSKQKPFAKLKIILPSEGIINYSENLLSLITFEKKLLLDFNKLKLIIKNCFSEISFLIQPYQYVDKYTIAGFFYFFPSFEGKIYSIRKKDSNYRVSFFIITEADVWKIHSDFVNNFSFFNDKKTGVRAGTLVHLTLKTKNSGFFLKKDGFQMVFQNAIPIFLSRGTILNYKQGDFLEEKKAIATLVNYTQQTEDIVQGLPKIEELIEARKPKVKSYLAIRPGILLNSNSLTLYKLHSIKRTLQNNVIKCILHSRDIEKNISKRKQDKQNVYISHSLFLKEDIVFFKEQIFKAIPIPSTFMPVPKPKVENKKQEFFFQNFRNENLLINKKLPLSTWKLESRRNKSDGIVYKYEKNELSPYFHLADEKNSIFKNKRGDFIILTNEKNYIFLEYLNPILKYELPLTSKLIFEVGNFVDIGEPITEGMIDIHELLHILFSYHSILDGMITGAMRSLHKFQLLLVNSIQAIYQSQGVNISSKHIEIIVRQMTAKVVILESGDTPFLPGEIIRFSLLSQVYEGLKLSQTKLRYKSPKFEPLLLSATNSSLTKDGFLSAAGFQETKRVLTKASVEGSSDWLRGLKECIIVGRLIPAGSTFLNYKNYLDNIYLFTTIEKDS